MPCEAWPLKESRARKHLEDIGRYKATISVALAAEQHGYVDLAHYTVKEYLISDRMKHGRAANFYLPESLADDLMTRSFLIYILGVGHQTVEESGPPWATDEYHLYYNAAYQWRDHLVHSEDYTPETNELLIKFLDPSAPHFGLWQDLAEEDYNESWRTCIPRWIRRPDARYTITLTYAIIFDFLGLAKFILTQSSNPLTLKEELEFDMEYMDEDVENFPEVLQGTPLHIAAALGKEDFVELLIEHGANVNSIASSKTAVLCSARTFTRRKPWTYKESVDDVIDILIKGGADLNPLHVAGVPLQTAVRNSRNLAIIKVMLAGGAKVNAVGDDEAVIAKLRIENQWIDEEDVDKILNERGLEHYYDTPLKHVTKKIESSDPDEPELTEPKDLLETHGGKALHLFPVRNLPGYVEADMKASRMDNEGIESPLRPGKRRDGAQDVAVGSQNPTELEIIQSQHPNNSLVDTWAFHSEPPLILGSANMLPNLVPGFPQTQPAAQVFPSPSRRLPAPWIAGNCYVCL